MISKNTKRELIEVLRKRYRVSMKNEKTKILDDFISLTGFHRKHAVRVLGGNPADQKSKQSFDRQGTIVKLTLLSLLDQELIGKTIKPG